MYCRCSQHRTLRSRSQQQDDAELNATHAENQPHLLISATQLTEIVAVGYHLTVSLNGKHWRARTSVVVIVWLPPLPAGCDARQQPRPLEPKQCVSVSMWVCLNGGPKKRRGVIRIFRMLECRYYCVSSSELPVQKYISLPICLAYNTKIPGLTARSANYIAAHVPYQCCAAMCLSNPISQRCRSRSFCFFRSFFTIALSTVPYERERSMLLFSVSLLSCAASMSSFCSSAYITNLLSFAWTGVFSICSLANACCLWCHRQCAAMAQKRPASVTFIPNALNQPFMILHRSSIPQTTAENFHRTIRELCTDCVNSDSVLYRR